MKKDGLFTCVYNYFLHAIIMIILEKYIMHNAWDSSYNSTWNIGCMYLNVLQVALASKTIVIKLKTDVKNWYMYIR